MKYVIALCLFGLAYSANPACHLEPETGPCKAYFQRYYYDSATGECKEFIYGGCRGNDNRFITEEECQKSCAVKETNEAICHLEPERGMCLGYFPRYYYNAKEGRCQEFIYGGCQGNPNNFKTLEECEASCTVARSDVPVCEQDVDSGNCLAYIPSYYYDKHTGKCKRFIYGGCGGNDNRFATEEKCKESCQVIEDAESVCELEAETGPCRGYFRRYYFNKESGECEAFVYGGCKGNDNNFETKDECEEQCSARSDVPVCEQDADPGNCRAYIPKYFYNKHTGKCERFIYGGCGGNDNRFSTEEECKESCQVIEDAESVCELEAETGPCRGYFRRYYFNKESGECEAFVYGGCKGNDNNFETKDECEEQCSVSQTESICEMDADPGICYAYMPRYHFNKKTGKCERFIYGGCQGNANNFKTEEECEFVCSAF